MPGLQAFPRNEHIRTSAEFREVFDAGRRVSVRGFIGYFQDASDGPRKFGMAVSRKVGNAVVRNRVKRYLREVYRRNRVTLRDGLCIVVVARPEAATMDYFQCETAIESLFRKGGARDE